MSARQTAEAMAKRIADECCAAGTGRRMKAGKQFIAIGGCDADGPWHFAADYETSEDRADVAAWLETLQ